MCGAREVGGLMVEVGTSDRRATAAKVLWRKEAHSCSASHDSASSSREAESLETKGHYG